jgi:hypothetical protein
MKMRTNGQKQINGKRQPPGLPEPPRQWQYYDKWRDVAQFGACFLGCAKCATMGHGRTGKEGETEGETRRQGDGAGLNTVERI